MRKPNLITVYATLFLLASLLAPRSAHAQIKRDSLAPTPPMGWNSWNKFQCNVSEDLIKSVADTLVSTGMRDAGYRYLVIDDCWQVGRDENGNILADPQRFPSGIKALADYVHSKDLKFGLYSDAGSETCGGRPGSQGHEYQDAIQYAKWGADYLKYDWCKTGTRNAEEAYSTMNNALLATGRPIVFSMCEWGTAKPWLWAAGIGNLWRTAGDIADRWEGKIPWPDGTCCSNGMLNIVDEQVPLGNASGPGHWNDPDMLEVGNGGMTIPEYRAHFSLWAMLAAPLIAGNDIRSMTPEIKSILTNKEVIAIDQDPLGRQGRRVFKKDDSEIWARPLIDGSRAVILFNRGKTDAEISVRWEQLAYPGHLSANVRDLWAARDLGSYTAAYSAKVPPHSVLMLKITP